MGCTIIKLRNKIQTEIVPSLFVSFENLEHKIVLEMPKISSFAIFVWFHHKDFVFIGKMVVSIKPGDKKEYNISAPKTHTHDTWKNCCMPGKFKEILIE